ncbi:MAG: PIN domain-containing protein [Gammaproteobacteria bacterium]|nr:MAG: PIN domain-containing protein [Gammaproteobacteria bacterium]
MTPDINVLLAAAVVEHPLHRAAHGWLEAAVNGCGTGGRIELLPMVVAGFLRLVTHPRVIVKPLPVKAAIAWVDELLDIAGVEMPEVCREWPIMKRLCTEGRLAADAVPDAWIAAAVIATGGHLVTFDRGFRRLLGRGQLTLLSGTS